MATSAPPKMMKRLGTKQIYLTNVILTLVRSPIGTPATFASFIVPLNFNKLDIRDYLWNVYGVPVIGVRSFIQLQKMRQDKPGSKRPSPRRWHRPRSIKRMMVEMERPFVFPEAPEDLEPWDKKAHEAAEKDQEKLDAKVSGEAAYKPTPERTSIMHQALSLLSKNKNSPMRPSRPPKMWENLGAEQEVEENVDLGVVEAEGEGGVKGGVEVVGEKGEGKGDKKIE